MAFVYNGAYFSEQTPRHEEARNCKPMCLLPLCGFVSSCLSGTIGFSSRLETGHGIANVDKKVPLAYLLVLIVWIVVGRDGQPLEKLT